MNMAAEAIFSLTAGKSREGADGPTDAESRAYSRCLDQHAAGAHHQVELEGDSFRRAVLVRLGAHSDHAVAQAPLQRAEALPLEPVDRISRRVRLRDHRTGEAFAPIVVMALAAR